METLCAFWNWIHDPNNLTAISTLVIAAFTIILAWVGYCQARLIRKTIDLARAEYISTHRPKIVLKDANIVDDKIVYMLANIGDTKATVVESWVLMEFVPNGTALRPLRSAGHDDLGRLTFEGGEMKDLTFDTPGKFSFEFRFPDTIRIGIGEAAVSGQRYFTGTIVYEDDVGIKRRAVFRRRLNLDKLSFERIDPQQERDHEYSD